VVHAGKRLVTAEGKVRDPAGRLYAMGVCSCLIFPAA
jgi:acyl-coenzyme A thioesterase PaaI-like protein